MSDLAFAREWMLALIPLPVLALAAWWWGVRRARERARAISRAPSAAPPYLAAILFTLAAVAAIGAAAHPRWGTRESQVPRTGADLVVVMDISRSMDARDVAPNRLQAAKTTVNSVMDRLGGDRVGLIIFAGDAQVRFPLTTDFAAARQVVSSLQTGVLLVEGGTNAALGLSEAVALLGEEDTGKVILLLTDGDDLGGDPVASAQLVQQSGADLMVAGVGTADGATIPVFDASEGGDVPKLDASGQPIVTKLNEGFLRALATASGGRYLGSDLSVVPGAIDGRLRALERSRIEERPTILPIERYQVFAGVALGLLVLAALAERFGRLPVRAGGAFAAIALLLVGCATEAYEANEAGRDALGEGNPDLAIEKFLEAQVAEPEDPEIALNLAAAYAAAGRHDEAIRSARRALASHRPETRARAYASIGHHQFESDRLPDALDAFRRSLLENPTDEARHDYEVVLRLLFPEEPPTPEATPSATVESADTPPAPQGTPTPGENSGGPGQQTAVPGTPTPGGTGSGRGTPTPGSGRPESLQDLERQIEELNERIDRLIEEAGEAPTTAQAYEILRLLAERSRIASLRSAFEGGGDPLDY